VADVACRRSSRPRSRGAAAQITVGEPDLVVVNARVFTSDTASPRAEAFAVKNGRFVAVGSTSDVRNLATARTPVVDPQRMFVTPGFIDAHCHPSGVEELYGVDTNLRTVREIQAAIKNHTACRLPHRTTADGGTRGMARPASSIQSSLRLQRQTNPWPSVCAGTPPARHRRCSRPHRRHVTEPHVRHTAGSSGDRPEGQSRDRTRALRHGEGNIVWK
jgi:hypothetical protein